jgi:PAS domain-containing protein
MTEPTTRARILEGAARQLRGTRSSFSDVVRTALKNRISGFRDPLVAPVPRLAQELDWLLYLDADWTHQLLGLWINSVPGFGEAISKFLGEVAETELLRGLYANDPEGWGPEDLLDLADRYLAGHPGQERSDVAIALADRIWQDLHQHAIDDEDDEVDDEVDEEHDEDETDEPSLTAAENPESSRVTPLFQSQFLSTVFGQFASLSEDAVEWRELQSFITALSGLSNEVERNAQKARAYAARRLKTLVESYPEALNFIEYATPLLATNLDIKSPAAVEDLCDRLDERLQRLTEALTRVTRSRLADLDALAEEAKGLLGEIEALALPASAPPAVIESAPPSPVIQDPEAVPPPKPEPPTIVSEPAPVPLPPAVLSPLPSGARLVEVPPRDAPTSVIPRDTRAMVGPAEVAEPDHAILQCTLITDGDLAGAYWIARSVEARDGQPVFPSWLLAAAQASPWLNADSPAFVSELLDLASTQQPVEPAQHLVGLSVALKAAVISPMTGLAAWLRPQDVRSAGLRAVCEAVAEFATYNTALHPDDLLGLSDASRMDAAIKEIVAEARRAKDAAEEKGAKMHRAREVWLQFARREVPKLLGPVVADQRARVTDVRSVLEQWRRHKDVQDWIDETDAKLVRGRGQPIVGDPRDQILRRVRDYCDIAARWCELVERAGITQGRGNWLLERVKALQASLVASLPHADADLQDLGRPERGFVLAAAARTLRRALVQFATTLRLPVRIHAEPSSWDEDLRAVEDGPDLQRALAARLFWVPELDLQDDGLPHPSSLPRVIDVLQAETSRSRGVLEACRAWISRRDFRFVDRLLRLVPSDRDARTVQEEASRAREAARAELRLEIDRTHEAIEQAVVDGVIAEQQRSEYAARIEVDVATVECFPHHLVALRTIRNTLDTARRTRLEHCRARWREMEADLAARFTGPRWEAVRAYVEALLARDDRAVFEALERLEDLLRGVADTLPEEWGAPSADRDVFADFLAQLPSLEEAGAAGLGPLQRSLRSRSPGLWDIADWPQARLAEAGRLLDAWLALKGGGWPTTGIADGVRTFLDFLGFVSSPDVHRLTQVATGPDWAHLRARMSAHDSSPVPQFGSQSRDVYDVLCVRERPGVDVLAARLRDIQLEGHPLIVIYLGRLSQNRRKDLSRAARRDDLAIIALDESLLLFLIGQSAPRLSTFFRSTLPYSTVNPFTPAQAGDVPPEMFRGRRSMVRELKRPEGGCVVYGGRQLGKSVVLRRVEREINSAGPGHHARVIDIKLLGDPHSGVAADDVWRRIRDAFKEFGLLNARIVSDQPKEIIRHLKEAMRSRALQQVVLLLDEADAFLDADAQQSFRNVTELRDLMNETRRRFKVVLAGLQNVQRFQGIPNQPLAHFGQPIRVGPLEPEAAERLVREPFRALGFQFTEPGVVLRVLSYTNYHPGLIQLFGQQLLWAQRIAKAAALPPYRIEAEDVERVYRQPVVRDAIRERFDWTLALDARYQCTAWAMIVDQASERDGYGKAYSAREALSLVQFWWSAGFHDMSLDRFRAVLDEMEGLGVLRKTVEGHYRLRSPNLVRLMGREADVSDQLMKLAERGETSLPDPDGYRAPLEPQGRSRRYSPLTYSDARRIAPPQSGVSLVFGSPALGVDLVAEAIEHAVHGPLSDGESRCLTGLAEAGADEQRLRTLLNRFAMANQRYERLTAIETVAVGDATVPGRVQAAARFCAERAARRGVTPFRVVFVFTPGPAWEWLRRGDEAADIEARLDGVVSLQLWTEGALRRRLEEEDKIASEVHSRQLLEATSGWPLLVDEIFQRSRRNPDVQTTTAEVKTELAAGGPLTERLATALGLSGIPLARATFGFVREMGDIDEIVPDLVAPDATDVHCRAALEWLARMSLVVSRGGRWSVDPVAAQVLASP